MKALQEKPISTKQKELNTRQWQLYEFIKRQKGWTSLSEIVEYFDYSSYRAIKENYRPHKVAVTCTTNGVKIANKKEYATHSQRRWKAIAKMARLQRILDRKAGLDGQCQAVFNSEKAYREAFLGE